jgi:hypothetical protein
MDFNGQPNMFFGMFISFTCDQHLKLDILNLLNMIFLSSNGVLNESFTLQPFLSKFQDFEIFEWVFHQVHPMAMYFHRKGHVFIVQKIEMNFMILCLLFYYFFKNVL